MGHNIETIVEDLAFDITNEVTDSLDTSPQKHRDTCPYVECKFNNENFVALLDSGSQVTCIAERTFLYLKERVRFEELPMSNISICPAFGKKPLTIKKQVLMNIQIGDRDFPTIFIVVPKLVHPIILGADWLSENRFVLDFEKQEIYCNDSCLGDSYAGFGRSLVDKLCVSVRIKNSQPVSEIPQEYGDTNQGDSKPYDCGNKLTNFVASHEENVIETNLNVAQLFETQAMLNAENQETESARNVADRESSDFCELNIENNSDDIVETDSASYMIDAFLSTQYSGAVENALEIDNLSAINICGITVNSIDNLDSECGNQIEGYHCIADHVGDKMNVNAQTVNHVSSNYSRKNNVDVTCNNSLSSEPLHRNYSDPEDHNFFIEARAIVQVLTCLTETQKSKLFNVLIQNRKVFSDKPGCTHIYEHKIEVKPHKSCVQRTYPVPLSQRPAVGTEIQQMLQDGIIELSNSSYCSPMRIVLKKPTGIRICLDARFINDIIFADNESPPPIDELLNKYEGVKVLSTTDLTSGYWQIPLEEESRKYTAFLHNGTLYQFCRVPFGLKTAGSGFMRALRIALGNDFNSSVTSYVDDLLITSSSYDEHIDHLDKLFTRLILCGFTLKLKKTLFFRDAVPFVGFILTPNGIRPDPEKLAVILNFPRPVDRKQLQGFIGSCTFYRRFTVKHAEKITPFRDLLSENTPWLWKPEHDKAFQELKDSFIDSVTLQHYLPNVPFRIQTDASDLGISAVLYQIDSKGDHRIISLISKCLSAAETRYTTTEKELLAIMYALLKFRIYLLGTYFHIITDHKALTFLKTCKFHTPRISRWILLMNQYTFQIEHCKGVDNIVADFFSRNFPDRVDNSDPKKIIVAALRNNFHSVNTDSTVCMISAVTSVKTDQNFIKLFKNLRQLQEQDKQLLVHIQSIQQGNQNPNYMIFNDLLFTKTKADSNWKIAVPEALVFEIMRSVHQQFGHVGVHKTYQEINRYYAWKGMRRQIKQYVISCDLCQRVKPLTYPMEGTYQLVESTEPNDLISVDFYGPLPISRGGVQYIFVILDVFSKLVTLYALKRATTRACINRLFNDYIVKIGKPKRVLSDNGSQFSSPSWKNKLEANNIQAIYSSVRHPKSNPVERTMRELGRFFRTYCSETHTKWACVLPDINNWLNLTVHSVTGFTPHELHFGENPASKIAEIIQFPPTIDTPHQVKIMQATERIRKEHENRGKQQKPASRVELQNGDLVMLKVPYPSDAIARKTHKFFHIYYGPFLISKVFNNNAFQLSHVENPGKIKGIYNRCSLRKYVQPEEH